MIKYAHVHSTLGSFLISQQGKVAHVPLTFSLLAVISEWSLGVTGVHTFLMGLVTTGVDWFPPGHLHLWLHSILLFFFKICFLVLPFLEPITHTHGGLQLLFPIKEQGTGYSGNSLHPNKACARPRYEQPVVSEVARVMMKHWPFLWSMSPFKWRIGKLVLLNLYNNRILF